MEVGEVAKEKVCIVAPVYPAVGGLRSVVWHLIRVLNVRYEVMVLSVKAREEERRGYVHCDIGLNPRLKLLFSPWHFPSFVLYFLSGVIWCFVLRMAGVKKFFAQDAVVSGFLVTFVGKILGAQAYLFDYAPMQDLYNPEFVKGARKDKRRLLRVFYAKWFRLMNEFSLRHCYRFFVYSEAIKRCAREHGLADEKMAFFSFPVDIGVFKAYDVDEREKIRERFGFEGDEIVVTYIGRISEDKGLLYLFKSARVLIEKYSGRVKFAVAGGGPLATWVADNVRSSEGRISYFGPLHTSAQVAELLNASDIFVHPITVSYGYALAVLEAMATGLPSIMTDVGLTKEVIVNDHDGMIIPTGDAEALTHALDRLINDEKLRKRIGENARKVLKNFSVETYKKTILSQIE